MILTVGYKKEGRTRGMRRRRGQCIVPARKYNDVSDQGINTLRGAFS